MSRYSKELALLAERVSVTNLQDPMQLVLLNIQLGALAVLAKEVLKEEEENELG